MVKTRIQAFWEQATPEERKRAAELAREHRDSSIEGGLYDPSDEVRVEALEEGYSMLDDLQALQRKPADPGS